jgi:hypothetical protein
MSAASDYAGTGLGGPGMWDPMPMVPPVRPPSEQDEAKLIWSRPEPEPAQPATPAAKPSRPRKAARRPAKKAAKRTAKKRPAKKKAVKKKAAKKKPARKKGRPVKKAAKRR